MLTKSFILKTSLFSFFLICSHYFLIQPGQWFFQDTSYWPKTAEEGYLFFNSQLTTFTTYGYALGFDVGLFAFSRFLLTTIIAGLFFLFGGGGAQLAFSVVGILLSFISFYLLTTLLIEEKKIRWILAMLYSFNPIMFSLQGYTIYFVIAPLFIYSLYQFLTSHTKSYMIYLLGIIFAAFIWIAYIRFIQAFLFIIIPYLFFLLWKKRGQIIYRRLLILLLSLLLVFGPTFLSFGWQIFEGGQTAFRYAEVYGSSIAKNPFVDVFSLFVNFPLPLYTIGYQFFGLVLFCLIVWGLIKKNSFYWSNALRLHLLLVLLSFSFFGLANIFGDTAYKFLIKFLPFLTNAPFFALYLLPLPLILLVGHIFSKNLKIFFLFSMLFILLSILPLLFLSTHQLKKLSLNDLPVEYQKSFIFDHLEFPESSLFIPGNCWRAEYMDQLSVPTICLNLGLFYNSVSFTDPRFTLGDSFDVTTNSLSIALEKLRITHNLKHVIIGSDFITNPSVPYRQNINDLDTLDKFEKELPLISHYNLSQKEPFKIFTDKRKNDYDYFLYSPKTFYSSNNHPATNSFAAGVFLSDEANVAIEKVLPVLVEYKTSFNQPTVHFVHVNITHPQQFFLQLNQTFSKGWKIKKIKKNDYENITCLGKSVYYSESNNSRCLYKSSFFLPLVLFFTNSEYKPLAHILSNELNNGFLLEESEGEHYYMIYYQKQVYFQIALLLSFLTLSVIIFTVCYRYIRK